MLDLRIFGNYHPQSFVGIRIAIDDHCSASLRRISGGICKRPFATKGRYRSPRSFRAGGGWVSAFVALGATMGWRVCFVAGLLSALLSGCASVGNERIADVSPETVSGQLIKGRTTQANVRELYGDPLKISFTDSGNEQWEYEFSRLYSKPTNFIPYVSLIHSGAEGDKKSLVIFFDKSKVVRQYTISTSKVDISHGLITR